MLQMWTAYAYITAYKLTVNKWRGQISGGDVLP